MPGEQVVALDFANISDKKGEILARVVVDNRNGRIRRYIEGAPFLAGARQVWRSTRG